MKAADRRARLVARMQDMLDAADRWELLLTALERQFDLDHDALDHAVGAIIEIPPERVALFAQAHGACLSAKRRPMSAIFADREATNAARVGAGR